MPARPGHPPPHRLPRAAVVAASATALGAAGHALAGGTVHPGGLVAIAAVLLGVTWAAAGRERGTTTIAALQIGLQQLVHIGLAGPGPSTVDPHHAAALPHELMLHIHIAAGLLTALLLRAGERRTWSAARRVAARLAARTAALLALVQVGTGPVRRRAAVPVAPAPARWARSRELLLRHALVLRGPPSAAA